MSDDDRNTRSFRPGAWFGIFGDNATVVLPPTEKPRVAGLWAMVDDGAGFDETLDELISAGLRDLPGFVLVSEVDRETRVVVRGPARATFITDDETVELDGASASTWVERTLHGVTRMAVEVADETGDSDLRVATGLVRVARVDEPPRSPRPPEAPVAPAGLLPDQPVAAEPDRRDDRDDPDHLEPTEPVPYLTADAWDPLSGPYVAEPDPERDPEPDLDPDPEPDPEPDTGSMDVADTGEQAVDDDEWDDPIWVPRSPAPPAAVAPPPFGAPVTAPPAYDGDDDHDGMTSSGSWSTGELARPEPGIPGQPAAPDVTARPVARLLFSSGDTVDVDRAVLVGRAPEAGRFTSTQHPRLVTVPSPQQEISSTHLEIRPGSGADHGSAVVTDMGSTNGTVLAQPGLPPEDLQPGIAVQLVPGAVVDLGDGVTIQVTNP